MLKREPKPLSVSQVYARRAAKSAPPGAALVGDKIRHLIALRRLRQADIQSESAGLIAKGKAKSKIHQTRLSRWIRNAGEPNLDQLHQLAVILDAPIGYLADTERTDLPPVEAIDLEREIAAIIKRIGPGETLRRLLATSPLPVSSIEIRRGEIETSGETGSRLKGGQG
jgi:transcriptional regulator with XRE-family HTH domain